MRFAYKNLSDRKTWLLIFVLFIVLALVQAGARQVGIKNSLKIETPSGAIIKTEVAETPEELALGLGGRERLGPNEGMFFIFPKGGMHSIWMKGMLFPIDVVWIEKDIWGRLIIRDIKENISPDTYPEAYYPKKRINYVLELPAGAVKRLNLKYGQILKIQNVPI